MKGRVIVITGASGGLAQAMVKQLPATDQIIVLGRSRASLEHCYKAYPNVLAYQLDISDDVAVETMVEELYATYGHIDVFVSNAGYGDFKPFEDFTAQETKDMLAVNTLAAMNLMRLFGQRMKDCGKGHLVAIVSMAGLIATQKASVYSASKFALIGFANALRLELAEHGVYVTTVNPGPIATKFFEQADPSGNYVKSVARFMLQPEQVAKKTVAIFGKKKRELNLPFVLHLAHKFYGLFPTLSDFLARKVFNYK